MDQGLHMHDRKTVYLSLRTYNYGYLPSLEVQQCVLKGAKPTLSGLLYDLPVEYKYLEQLKDILHSNQLGPMARILHDDEVDFSRDTRGIAGALQGSACEEHEWWVQEDPRINCKEHSTDVICIKRIYTSTNIAQFKHMKLKDRTKYHICVHASGGSCNSFKVCSNGFIIDTQPPLAGNVFVGHDINSGIHSDNNSIYIYWEAFSDLEDEIEVPYASGIKEYFYAIGKLQYKLHLFHDDDHVTSH